MFSFCIHQVNTTLACICLKELAARQIVMKNPVIEGMIDWYLVLRDIPALAEMQKEMRKPLAVGEKNVIYV